MCGIAAWAGAWTTEDVHQLLTLAAQRGPHAWGLATARWRHVAIGRYAPPLPTVPLAGAMIGHTRLATSADRRSLDAAQPLCTGAVTIAHNGTVEDAAAWNLPWPSGNDSEVLARWIELNDVASLGQLASSLRRPYALAVLRGEDVWLLRRRHPLYAAPGRACSRPFAGAVLLPEDQPIRLDRVGAARNDAPPEPSATPADRPIVAGRRRRPAATPVTAPPAQEVQP